MQGTISFDGTLSGGITGGGGGGGGGNVYDVKVKTSSQYESVVNEEDKIAYIDLSGYATKSELSGFVTSEALETTLEDYPTYQYTESRYTPLATFNAYTLSAESHFQRTLTAGTNITIDPVTNVISASGGGSWNYSTSEVNTGQKWIDGKDLYVRVIQVDNLAAVTESAALITNVDFYTCLGITMRVHGSTTSYSPSQISMYNYQGVGTTYAVLFYDSTTKELKISNNSRTNSCDVTAIVMYTKDV